MKTLIPLAITFFLSLSVVSPVFSQDNQQASRAKKIQMLEQAAKAHQAAADCLKAGKPESECRAAMKKNMPMKGDMEGCPMMDDHQMMKGGNASPPHHDQGASREEAPEE